MSENRLPTIQRFPNQQIASITEPFKDPETGRYDVRLISKGMSKEDIETFFPPSPLSIAKAEKKGKLAPTFNMREFIRSLIVEEFEKLVQKSNSPSGIFANFRSLFDFKIDESSIDVTLEKGICQNPFNLLRMSNKTEFIKTRIGKYLNPTTTVHYWQEQNEFVFIIPFINPVNNNYLGGLKVKLNGRQSSGNYSYEKMNFPQRQRRRW